MDYDSAPILAARANILSHIGVFASAKQRIASAIDLERDNGGYWALYGEILSELGDYGGALASYQMKSPPDAADAHYRRGLIHERMGQLDEATACYRKAPGHALAECSLAYMELVRGNYGRAWELYEARWRAQTKEETEPHILSNPRWARQRDAVVLVYAEQGMGDTIHFCRYAHMLHTRYGCRVYLEVQKPLVRLLQSLPGIDKVFAYDGDIPTDIQYVLPMLSLPLALGLNTEAALASVPYIGVHPQEIVLTFNALRVGLCWAGGQRINPLKLLEIDKRRDIPLWELSPLAELEDIYWVSLQVGEPSVQALNSPLSIFDITDTLQDFYDTAQLISCLDVVVTIDTAVAHLAGAMGKRVLLMVRFDPCWRWHNERNAKLCYPTLEVFRQKSYGDWGSVVAAVKERLRALQQLSVSGS